MSLNPVKLIYKFNKEAGLLDTDYIDEKECAFPIEEMLEALNTTSLCDTLGTPNANPKLLSRRIMALTSVPMDITELDRLDKHLDTIVYSFGSIFKLGLTPQQAIAALEIVAQANMQKLSVGTDDHGKQMKPVNFIGPEERLQALLDKREL